MLYSLNMAYIFRKGILDMHRRLNINKLVGTIWTSYMTDELCMVKHVYWTVQMKTPFRFKAFKLF